MLSVCLNPGHCSLSELVTQVSKLDFLFLTPAEALALWLPVLGGPSHHPGGLPYLQPSQDPASFLLGCGLLL